MIRVLHYGMGPNLGGIETYLFNLARALDPTGVHSDFLYSDTGSLPVFAAELEPLGCRFFGVTPRRSNPKRNRRDLEDLFRRERFDILHFHAASASYVQPVRAALAHGVHVVVHSHNANASRSPLSRALHRWHRGTLPWDRVTRLAVSQEAGRWMFGNRTFEVIRAGIDVEAFAFRADARAAVRSSLDIDGGTLVVGQVGAMRPAKNHTFTLAVFDELVRRNPDARLLLVGTGPLEGHILRRVDDLGLRDKVLFLGRRTDVPDLLAAMDALLFPSLHEGFGLVALEAQASGLPVIMSDQVPPDANITPLCHALPLAESPETWAEAVSNAAPVNDRPQGARLVADAGVTADAVAAQIASIYRRPR